MGIGTFLLPGLARGPKPVVRFEKITVTIAANSSSTTQNLSQITNHAHCVPFASWRASAVDGFAQGSSDHLILVEMINNAGTPAVRVSRGGLGNATFGVTVLIYVVQFNPALVKVQQVVSTSAASPIDHAITAVSNLNKAFVVGYFRPNAAGNSQGQCNIFASLHFTATNNVRFTRGTSFDASAHTFASYVVEDIHGGLFDVQHLTKATGWWPADNSTANVAASNTIAMTSINTAMSFILGSVRMDGNNTNGANIHSYNFSFNSATAINFFAADANASYDDGEMRVQVVTFRAGIIAGTKAAGNAMASPFTGGSTTFTIAAVTLANAIVVPNVQCRMGNLSSEGFSNSSYNRMVSTMELTSTTVVTVTPTPGTNAEPTWGACTVLEFLP